MSHHIPKSSVSSPAEWDRLLAEMEMQLRGIECEECGEVYEPMTDAYKCPCCGVENYSDSEGMP